VRADRGVDAAGTIELVRADDFFVEALAHAVQALELILADLELRPRHGVERGEGQRVVGGELRKDHVGCG
jgi:hypothetical protein